MASTSHNDFTRTPRIKSSSMKPSVLAKLQDEDLNLLEPPTTPKLSIVEAFASRPPPPPSSPIATSSTPRRTRQANPITQPKTENPSQSSTIPPLLAKLWAQEAKSRHTWWQTPRAAWSSRVYAAPAWEDPLPTLDSLLHALPAEDLQERRVRPNAIRASQVVKPIVGRRLGPHVKATPETLQGLQNRTDDTSRPERRTTKAEPQAEQTTDERRDFQQLQQQQQKTKTANVRKNPLEQFGEIVKKLEMLKAEFDGLDEKERVNEEGEDDAGGLKRVESGGLVNAEGFGHAAYVDCYDDDNGVGNNP